MSAGRVLSRLRLSLAACLVLVAAGIFVASAGAIPTKNSGMAPGPAISSGGDFAPGTYPAFPGTDTNVPLLAWRGETIRFVKCDERIPRSGIVLPNYTIGGLLSGNRANLWVEDFSGDPHEPWPQAVTGTFYFFHSSRFEGDDGNCIGGAFSSNKAGIAQIKLMVFEQDEDKQPLVLEHTFLAGWLGINSARITNTASVTEPPGTSPGNAAIVEVTGKIPVNSEFQTDWGLPATLVLPGTDWSLWAHAMATIGGDLADWHDRGAGYVEPWRYWDIHDSSGPTSLGGDGGNPDQHVAGVSFLDSDSTTGDPFGDCTDSDPKASPPVTVDQVDNCNGGPAADDPVNNGVYNDVSTPFGTAPQGPRIAQSNAWNGDLFSRVFGDVHGSGVGPFDPGYPRTLLSDGNLNALDTPLPPLQINYKVSCVDTSGNSCTMGYFIGVDPEENYNGPQPSKSEALANKSLVYSRDKTKPLATPHNLYAPYYGSYIPGTSRGAGDSEGNGYGDASGTMGNSSAGEANNFDGYQEFGLYPFWSTEDQVRSFGQETDCLLRFRDNQPVFRRTNQGNTTVAVYTDEHGEARTAYEPGLNSDAFANAFIDDDLGCDLQGVALGPQTISATAVYPFQKVAQPFAVSGTITKNITNLFNKSVSCHRKNNTSGIIVYICTVSAQDINGSGTVFNGEEVCLVRDPSNVWYLVAGRTAYPNPICVTLAGGDATHPATASAETDATRIGEKINITARFVDELLIRGTCITVSANPADVSVPGNCTGIVAGGLGGTQGGSTGPSGTGGITSLRPGSKVAKASASVASVRLVVTARGRVLKVRVNSATKKVARIQVRLINARGRVTKIVARTVKTNKLVLVPNLRVAKNVKSVRVKVLS